MGRSTSSAVPLQLFRYSDAGRHINADLNAEASRMTGVLQHFEATCREYPVAVSHIPGQVSAYAGKNDDTDAWVWKVAADFRQADTASDVLSPSSEAARQFLELVWDFSKKRTEFHSSLQLIGRFLNGAMGEGKIGMMYGVHELLSHGIPYRGQLDHVLKSKWVKNGFPVLTTALDVWEDFNAGAYGGDLAKIIGVDSTDTVLNLAIAETGVGAAVLVANGLIQVGGNLQVAAQRSLTGIVGTDSEMRAMLGADADRVADAVDRMNVDHVTKAISETIYDVYAAPCVDLAKTEVKAIQQVWQDPSYDSLAQASQSVLSAARQDLPTIALNLMMPGGALVTNPERMAKGGVDTLKAVGNVLDGALDWSVSTGASVENLGLGVIDMGFSALPASSSVRDAVHDTLRDAMDRNEQEADALVNLVNIPTDESSTDEGGRGGSW